MAFYMKYFDEKEFSIKELTSTVTAKSKGIKICGDVRKYISILTDKIEKAYEKTKKQNLPTARSKRKNARSKRSKYGNDGLRF